jgi:hypothetical protein
LLFLEEQTNIARHPLQLDRKHLLCLMGGNCAAVRVQCAEHCSPAHTVEAGQGLKLAALMAEPV